MRPFHSVIHESLKALRYLKRGLILVGEAKEKFKEENPGNINEILDALNESQRRMLQLRRYHRRYFFLGILLAICFTGAGIFDGAIAVSVFRHAMDSFNLGDFGWALICGICSALLLYLGHRQIFGSEE